MQLRCVALPVESTAMSTPRFPVHPRTSLLQSCPWSSTHRSAPSALARSSFHWWRLVTATGQAMCLASVNAAAATPPPMPVISTDCPGRRRPLLIIME